MGYAELHCHTNFSFLEGASHPEELAERAAELGLSAVAATDRDGLYGTVRVGKAMRARGLAAIVGAEVTLGEADGPPSHLTLLVEDAGGYANLCRMLSRAQLAGRKGEPRLTPELLREHAGGLACLSGCRRGPLATLVRRGLRREALARGRWLRDVFGYKRLWVELQRHHLPGDKRLVGELAALAERLGAGVVATNTVLYARPEGRRLQDVLTCIKHRTTLERAGSLLRPNGEFHLKSEAEMRELFADLPQAITNTERVAERCTFRIEDLGHVFPAFPVPDGETSASYLRRLCEGVAGERYPSITPAVTSQLAHELGVIEQLGLADYFLVVWDLMRFAREQGILGQGRGSAANSIVAYVLGITQVDPLKLDLLFERFLSEGRQGAPDIDIDFANRHRERVIQYLYERYGRDHAGMVAEVITYRPRSAIRDVGKALGLSLAQVDALAKEVDHYKWTPQGRAAAVDANGADSSPAGADATHPVTLLDSLCRQIEGYPRHLGIHVGGMVITGRPLLEVAPLEWAAMPGRTVAQWDKDDCEDLGLIKIDLLGLGMLSVIQDCLALVERHRDTRVDLARLTYDEPAVYDTLCKADTVGLFQVESRAQMNTLPRLKPRSFYDLVVEIALIRPGPIQGDMVHPYLRRRAGEEPVAYAHPSLEPILARTLGVPLFQEQGMKLAIQAAGFTPAQADELRRTMGHKRSRERMEALRDALLAGMRRNGIAGQAAETIWTQLSSFADYGFPESHAASFAHLVYASAWLKLHYAAEYLCAMLNNQPMGFYPPAVLVADARRHGVRLLPAHVNRSRVDCTIEGAGAVRLGLRYVRGVGEGAFARLDAEAGRGPYTSLADLCRRSGLERRALEALIAVGAADGLAASRTRRQLLWELPAALEEARRGGLPGLAQDAEAAELGEPTEVEQANAEYLLLGLSPGRHALEFYRDELRGRGVRAADELPHLPHGNMVTVGGLVICRQAPPTAKGHVFLTLEDETGMANVVIRPQVYAEYRSLVRNTSVLLATGRLQREQGVTNLIARSFATLDAASVGGAARSHDWG